MNYINLTDGLKVAEKYKNTNYIYIRSSHAESHAWDRLFYGLSDDLLYRLAKGEKCTIIDVTSNSDGKLRKRIIPIIKYILNKEWFEIDVRQPPHSHEYLRKVASNLSYQTKRKIRYYKHHLNINSIKLDSIIYNDRQL